MSCAPTIHGRDGRDGRHNRPAETPAPPATHLFRRLVLPAGFQFLADAQDYIWQEEIGQVFQSARRVAKKGLSTVESMDNTTDSMESVEPMDSVVENSAAETDNPGKTGIQVGLIMLYVADMAKSRAFYEGTLGLSVVPRLSNDEFVFLQLAGGSPIALQSTAAAPEGMQTQPGGCELGFEVDDVDAVLNAWTEQGVPGLTEIIDMGAGRMFRAQDPDGRIINVYTLYTQVREFRSSQGM
jgi:catechol 2,3-dioxygenase-like lactoylglutathione lyase family enzyme